METLHFMLIFALISEMLTKYCLIRNLQAVILQAYLRETIGKFSHSIIQQQFS